MADWEFTGISATNVPEWQEALRAGRPTPAGQEWVDRAARGELVSPALRNAFVTERAGCMDLLVNPALLTAAQPAAQVPYHGPVAEWNGRNVPLVGSLAAPRDWWAKPAPRSSGGLAPAKVNPIVELLQPTADERKRLWLAHYNTLKSLRRVDVVADPAAPRSAGVVPVLIIVAVALVVCVGLVLVAWSYVNRIRETEETARRARELQESTSEWMVRAQESIRTGRPIPPGPAEVALQTRVAADAARANNNAAEDPFTQMETWLKRGALMLGAGLVGVEVLPPVIANIADRATRPRGV